MFLGKGMVVASQENTADNQQTTHQTGPCFTQHKLCEYLLCDITEAGAMTDDGCQDGAQQVKCMPLKSGHPSSVSGSHVHVEVEIQHHEVVL